MQSTVRAARRKVNTIAARPSTRGRTLRQGQHGWEKTLCLTQGHHSTSGSTRECLVSLLLLRREDDSKSRTLPEAAVGSGESKNLHPPSVPISWGLPGTAEPCPGDTTCGTRHSAQQGLGARMHWLPGELPGEPVLPLSRTPALPGSGPRVAADGLRQENCRASPRLPPPCGPGCDVTAMTSHHAGPGRCEVRALLGHVALWATTAWLEAARAVLVSVCPWQECF